MMKEGIRLLDVLPRQISVKAELILVADGDDARTKGRIIWSPVIRGLAGQEMAVRTEVKNGSDSAWLGGTNSLKLRARVNGDNTISLDADWEADLSIRVSGMAGPLHIVHTASGALRMASGETQVLTGAIVKLGGKGPDSQLLLFLTPAQVYDSQETGPSNPDTNKQP
jgi:hypothetical protein